MISAAISVASIIAIVWAFRTLAELQRGQHELQEEFERVAEALGVPPRPRKPVVVCEKCGAEYPAELTGCNICGQAKPKGAVTRVPSDGSGISP